MPQLGRNVSVGLLRTVGGVTQDRYYASADPAAPTSPPTMSDTNDDDVAREPESSSAGPSTPEPDEKESLAVGGSKKRKRGAENAGAKRSSNRFSIDSDRDAVRTEATIDPDGPLFNAASYKNSQSGRINTYSRGTGNHAKKRHAVQGKPAPATEEQKETTKPKYVPPQTYSAAPAFKDPKPWEGKTNDQPATSKKLKGARKKAKDEPKDTKLARDVFRMPQITSVAKKLGINTDAAQKANDSASDVDLHYLNDADVMDMDIQLLEGSGESPYSPLSSTSSGIVANQDFLSSLDPDVNPENDELVRTTPCPLCRTDVALKQYREFLASIPGCKPGQRLTVSQQLRFCKFHKDNLARKQWDRRGYPMIDWQVLPNRVRDLQNDIEGIIDGSLDSHYTNKLLQNRDEMERKQRRRQRLSSEFQGDFGAERVGYYGGQGAKQIGETVAEICSGKLKENRGHAAMAAAGGLSLYIQTIVVPEVASRLIAEDKKCDLEKAREILVESAELGKLLSEEQNDEVHEEEEDEDDDYGS